MSISLSLNGEKKNVQANSSLEQLIIELGFQDKKIAVELNEEIIPRSLFSETILRENDCLEVVHAIGGG